MSGLSGRCLCGSITVELSAAPVAIALCHCGHCRAAGGTAFSVNGMTPDAAVTIRGDLATYHAVGESGRRVTRRFCGGCGSPVETVSDDLAEAGLRVVKMGLFEPGSYAAPTLELWCDRRAEWLPPLAGTAAFPRMPPAP